MIAAAFLYDDSPQRCYQVVRYQETKKCLQPLSLVKSRCQPYIACSSESEEGFCKHVDTTCSAINTCRTCDTFDANGGACTALDIFPNATVAEYGHIKGEDDTASQRVMMIKKEKETSPAGKNGSGISSRASSQEP